MGNPKDYERDESKFDPALSFADEFRQNILNYPEQQRNAIRELSNDPIDVNFDTLKGDKLVSSIDELTYSNEDEHGHKLTPGWIYAKGVHYTQEAPAGLKVAAIITVGMAITGLVAGVRHRRNKMK